MTTITTEAIQHAYDAVIERLEIAGEIANTNREIAYLFTAARFAVEASQRLATLQAELAACRQLAQRLATEIGVIPMTPELLQAAVVGALRGRSYLADWHIAEALGVDPGVFGGKGVPGPGADAIEELVKAGVIEELADLGCRYRLVTEAGQGQLTAADLGLDYKTLSAGATALYAMVLITQQTGGPVTPLTERAAGVLEAAAKRVLERSKATEASDDS